MDKIYCQPNPNLIFMFPYIIMNLPIFVIAEWATLLVDIRGLAALMSADIARNL